MTPDWLLAIDPGKECLGWALFYKGRLYRCGVSRTKLTKDVGVCAAEHITNLRLVGVGGMHVVVERPQIYELRKQKGDQNDLVAIALIGAEVARAFSVAPVRYVYPKGWKGQMSKKVSHERIDRRLNQKERDVRDAQLPKTKIRHNGIDAIGIGLWGVGRQA